MANLVKYKSATVKVYHGYGHTHNLVVYGHVYKREPVIRHKYSNNVLLNTYHLLRMFFITPLANVKVQLRWNGQVLQSETEKDGFFKFEWASDEDVPAGSHPVVVSYTDNSGNTLATGSGKIFVPHTTQYAFLSDIDDTVLISHSATIGKRLRLLFTKNPRTRKAFAHVVDFYTLLAAAHTTAEVPNPFFYVSSSEWNLYDDLDDFFTYNGLPPGAFLLNSLKRWFELFKTGKTKHEGKLIKAARIMDVFPQQQFVLLGDNSQSDPSIYASVADKYPEKIFAIFIRNIRAERAMNTKELLQGLEQKGVHTFLYKDSREAMEYAKKIGLIA